MMYGEVPVFQALKQKMQWHQFRQGVLSENVANADTPDFRSTDVKPLKFAEELALPGPGNVAARLTNVAHIEGQTRSAAEFKASGGSPFEITPDGNEVTLEEQMMKVAGNQMDYQAATSLYSRSLKMIKTALGKA